MYVFCKLHFFVVVRKPSEIYQTKCALCRFVTLHMTHITVFSSRTSLFFSFSVRWNCMKCTFFRFQLVWNKPYRIHEFLFCIKHAGSLLLVKANRIKISLPSVHLLFIHSQGLYDFLYGRNFVKFIEFVLFQTEEYCDNEKLNFVYLTKIALCNIRSGGAPVPPSGNIHHEPYNLY